MTVHFSDVAKPLPVAGHAGSKPAAATATGFYARNGKRMLDVALVLLTAPLTLFVVALMAVVTAIDGHSPFYAQSRVGKRGAAFRIRKMRTMVPDADALLQAYLQSNPDARAEWDISQKLKADPRVTRVGKLLRKTSLDELPQLWNVLMGEMSLVGPRPMMTSQTGLYHGQAYYTVRPGITGLWQIKDRNSSAFEKRVRFDNEYAETLSFWGDLMILVRTVGIVAKGTGY